MIKQVLSVKEFKKLNGKRINTRRGYMKKHSPGKNHIETVLRSLELHYEKEFMFVPGRKFRSDYCIPQHKILIEYEGLVFNSHQESTGKSGHTTVKGYSGNCTKYNLAVIYGYRLLRYTALNYKNIYGDLKSILKS